MNKYLYTAVFCLALSCAAYAQATPAAATEKAQQSAQDIPLEKRDTTAVVPVANAQANPNASYNKTALPPKGGLRIVGSQEELTDEETDIPQGTIAVYIDIEEAFNKNPWTLQARRNMRIDLEQRQIEFSQIQQQLKELRAKEENYYKEIEYYKPFFQKSVVIEPDNQNIFPKLRYEITDEMMATMAFSLADSRVESPQNTPQKMEHLKAALKDTRKSIIEKEAFLRNYKEISREEVLSKQDFIVQEILKQIYSGIKEFAKVRSIAIVVDKKDLIYGKPLNVTDEFVKWMKTYHKKYVKENGDISL